MVHGVILAGGSGTRLWPLSRIKRPKQLIPFVQNKTLLELTLERINVLTDYSSVVTTQKYIELIQKSLLKSFSRDINYIIEPEARNTAPAILLSCLEIFAQDPEAIVFFVPADHVIEPAEFFVRDMQQVIKYAQNTHKLVLIGVKPTRVSIEYGYIEFESTSLLVKKFHEKPEKEKAQEYLLKKNMLWNCGIFCARVTVFLELYQNYAPDLYRAVEQNYNAAEAISFDHAILEKTVDECMAVPAHFSWSDVGTLDTFMAAQHDRSAILLESNNNHVIAQKQVLLSGVNNLIIIETDDILFIADREKTDIKKITQQLRHMGLENYL